MQPTDTTVKTFNSVDHSWDPGERNIIAELGVPFLQLASGDLLCVRAAVRSAPNDTPNDINLTLAIRDENDDGIEFEAVTIPDGQVWTTEIEATFGVSEGHLKAAFGVQRSWDPDGVLQTETSVTIPEVTVATPTEMRLIGIGTVAWTDQLIYCFVTRIRPALAS